MQVLALALIKVSILLFYRRIFLGRAFNVASWVLIGVGVAWGFAFFIVQFAACGTSLAAEWSSLAALKGKCVNTFDVFIFLSAFDVALDLAILLIPIPLVRKPRNLNHDQHIDRKSRCSNCKYPYAGDSLS